MAAVVLLLLAYLALGVAWEEGSGEAMVTDLVPVEADVRVNGISGNPADFGDVPESDLPPESTLGHGGDTLNAQGEILGMWEPGGLFSGSTGSPSKNRADPYLTLTDGDLLTVPRGAILTFRYGGEVDPGRDVFDALVFEVEGGELSHAEDAGWLEIWSDKSGASQPVALPARLSETLGQEVVEVKADVPPGVYVVSVSASVEEGNARYNFRVLVE